MDVLAVREITAWFAEHGRALPWRTQHPGPWAMLVVEVMSQQTPIMRVEPVWREWMERWPTAGDVAHASPAEILRVWGRMGYPRRALYLHEAAKQILERFSGRVPDTMEDLLSLPGVGPYTAGAVLSFGYGQRAVVLDTNIRRVLTRIFDGAALPTTHVQARERTRAQEVMPPGPESVTWNAAVMEFGALVCTARAPRCDVCPVTTCAWRQAGFPQNAPNRAPQKFQGTVRQLRGEVMGLLRRATAPVPAAEIVEHVQSLHEWGSESMIEQALAGLLADALIEQPPHAPTGEERYRLPH